MTAISKKHHSAARYSKNHGDAGKRHSEKPKGFITQSVKTEGDIKTSIAQGAKAYQSVFDSAAQKYGVPSGILRAIAYHESRFNPDAYNKSGGDTGLMQVRHVAAVGMGMGNLNMFDPQNNVNCGAKLLSTDLKTFGGDMKKALTAYAMGPGAAQNAFSKGHIPGAAQEFVNFVTENQNA